jgi:glycosyltransferase involved in cell wall biosynthesis
MSRKKILWLCSWYPNRYDPFNGDFIQRHARAASLFNDIHVIYLAPDTTGAVSQKENIIHTDENLTEQVIYYKKKAGFFGRLRAHYRWLFLYRQALRNYIIKNGKPDLVHVHVPMKAGMLAIWLKRKYRIPFVVTEHWGIYNDVEENNYASKSKVFQHYTRQVFEMASAFISVSRFLAEGINRQVTRKVYTVIPNVADTTSFYFSDKQVTTFRFIHVSNMVPLKNAEGIIRVFAKLHQQNSATELVMVGDREDPIRKYASDTGLPNSAIRFTGEIAYEQVAREMQQAHCLVLFSNIENSPCVIGEALCCGLPVIATNVGGIPELVDESNSILVKPQQDDELLKAMVKVMENYKQFNRQAIANNAASRFSYDVVGKAMDTVYDNTLSGGK